MALPYYTHASGSPADQTRALAAVIRDELDLIAQSFNLLPVPAALVGGLQNYAVDTGTANAYAVTLSPIVVAYSDGMTIRIKVTNANTGASTLNINGLGIRSLVRPDGTSLAANDVWPGQIIQVSYNATTSQFQLQLTPLAAVYQALGFATAAAGSASTASGAASTAVTAAGQAEVSRIEASKLNLGNKAEPPTVDNQGQALRAGATYWDTTLGKWRVWTGSAWGDGINVVAGVSSLNGETGAIVKSTLAGYGITNFKIESVGNADLNTLLTPGQYRFSAASPNSPPGVINSVLSVQRVDDTGSQLVVDYLTGMELTRGFIVSGGVTTFSPWRRQNADNPPWIDVGSGSVIDLNLGSNFKVAVSSNRTFTFNFGDAGRSFFVEVTHTGGAFSFAAAAYGNNNTPPTLAVNRRHLFFFQLASNANAWLASCIASYPL